MQNKDIAIGAGIPFLRAKNVLLIEDPANPIQIPNPDYWAEVQYHFKRAGFHFIFIPELLSGITPMIADYLFPGYDAPDASATYQLIRELAGLGNRCGLIYKKGRATWFKELSVDGKDLHDAIWALLEDFHESSQTRFRIKKETTGMFEMDMLERKLDIPEEPCSTPHEPATHVRFSIVGDYYEELDERTQYILYDVQQFLKEHHLTLDELRVIIGYRVRLSRMEITRTGKIFLMDFKDKETGQPKEVKMDSLTKMLYFFYLKHPEGIRVKEVDSHIDELMHIYMGITGRDDKDAIRASIRGHVAPYSNSINVSMSRIKTAFKNQVDVSVAKFYWVEGVSGEPYRVALDRDYVIWRY